MELTDKCPLCGGKDCKRSPITEGAWIGSEGFHLQCEKGFRCIIHPSVWYGEQKISSNILTNEKCTFYK